MTSAMVLGNDCASCAVRDYRLNISSKIAKFEDSVTQIVSR